MKRLVIVSCLLLAGVNHCSENNDASSRQTLLDHPHFFRNALPACSLADVLLKDKVNSCFEKNKPSLKYGVSNSRFLISFAAYAALRFSFYVAAGHCIDLERARSKRIEGMLKK